MIGRLTLTMAALASAALLFAAPSSASSGGVSASSSSDARAAQAQVPTGIEGRELMRGIAASLGLQLTDQELDVHTLNILGSEVVESVSAQAAADPCPGNDAVAVACRKILDAARNAGANVSKCGQALARLFGKRTVKGLSEAVQDCGGPRVVATALASLGLTLNAFCKDIVPNPLGLGHAACDLFF